MSDRPRDPDPGPVVLTGITGFIAKRIAADLLNAGYAVRGTLRSPARTGEVRAALRPVLRDPAAADARLSFSEADLTTDAGWPEAMDGARALVHTASPFPLAQPKTDAELTRPAVDGTLRALRAAQSAGVTRVVLTSSVVAILHNERPQGHVHTEEDWTETGHPTATPYARSKTLAERAAWNFAADHPEMQLTAINPGLVVGRPLDARYGTSLQVVARFLSGKDPMVPDFGLAVVDVADVSAMHVAALERPATAGRRYIAAERFVMAPEMTRWLADAFPGRRIPTRIAPRWLLRALALADPAVRAILPAIGDEKRLSNARAREELGITFRPAKDAVLASAAFLDEAGRATPA
ncbi:NAD-dependent epimerase/dehydratase family protein [Rhodovulum sp. 12E13]|uniref:NAD-dependent epimerase/dehydratase family protein n=1 Tax=Rhodovulum sp. 12E13 TaxID=2203891 RepID=UPI000E17228E|nr:NAD-dependent epimerase/dehydratase family protein [Rhodovulum sp. 12E13]RDC72876.1 NAD-dependent epimerase/dehydratase family protein [Rhodovulum sp. 12E13]